MLGMEGESYQLHCMKSILLTQQASQTQGELPEGGIPCFRCLSITPEKYDPMMRGCIYSASCLDKGAVDA